MINEELEAIETRHRLIRDSHHKSEQDSPIATLRDLYVKDVRALMAHIDELNEQIDGMENTTWEKSEQ